MVARIGARQEPGGEQRVVQLVGVARIGARFVAHALDRRLRRAHPDRRRRTARAGAPRVDRLRPPLLERRVVQERVGPRVQNLVREAATARACRARRTGSPPLWIRASTAASALKSIASSRQSRTAWPTSGWSGISRSPGMFFQTGGGVREYGRHQIVGEHPLNCGGTFLPPRLRGTASEMVVFQRQRVWNTGASSNACTRTSRVVAGCR